MAPRHIIAPVSDQPTDSGDERSSRRELLGRLTGLGLVAAGSLTLLAEDADAKNRAKAKAKAK